MNFGFKKWEKLSNSCPLPSPNINTYGALGCFSQVNSTNPSKTYNSYIIHTSVLKLTKTPGDVIKMQIQLQLLCIRSKSLAISQVMLIVLLKPDIKLQRFKLLHYLQKESFQTLFIKCILKLILKPYKVYLYKHKKQL